MMLRGKSNLPYIGFGNLIYRIISLLNIFSWHISCISILYSSPDYRSVYQLRIS